MTKRAIQEFLVFGRRIVLTLAALEVARADAKTETSARTQVPRGTRAAISVFSATTSLGTVVNVSNAVVSASERCQIASSNVLARRNQLGGRTLEIKSVRLHACLEQFFYSVGSRPDEYPMCTLSYCGYSPDHRLCSFCLSRWSGEPMDWQLRRLIVTV